MATKFTPSVWAAEGEKVCQSADDFYSGAEPVILADVISSSSGSRLDNAMVRMDVSMIHPWHNVIGSAFEALQAVGSQMVGTGSDYAATEEAATSAAERFWN